MKLNYPEHKHPHRVDNTRADGYRIWVCEECFHIFSDTEIKEDIEKGWGHFCKSNCKSKVDNRCEGHLEAYMPEIE